MLSMVLVAPLGDDGTFYSVLAGTSSIYLYIYIYMYMYIYIDLWLLSS